MTGEGPQAALARLYGGSEVAHAAREQRSVRFASMLLSLAFLAPDLVKAAVERRPARDRA